MRNIWSLVKKEVRAYFSSPIAYAVTAGFLLLVGYSFYNGMAWFNDAAMQMAQNPYYAQQININEMVFVPLFHNMTIFLVFIVPLLTMRLLAEEKKTGTEELLFTSPLTVGQIVVGKYVAALVMRGGHARPDAVLPVFLRFGNPESPVAHRLPGTFPNGGACIGIGLFFSSLTENQIVAGVLTLLTLLLFFILHWISTIGSGAWQGVVNYLAFSRTSRT
jgi:ABC-2 type transport system permease protein